MRLKKAIFINRAPFDKLELNFDNSNIFLLSGVNGKGKTTILSYIVDAFYELAKKVITMNLQVSPISIIEYLLIYIHSTTVRSQLFT